MVQFLKGLGWWGALGLSVILALGSIALAVVVVVQWPVDHFKGESPPPFWAHRHPVVRAIGLLAKNVAGVLIILLGIVMALPGIPGQGALLILIGLTFINFPGKRRLERDLIGRKSIARVINQVRRRFHRPDLELE